jgi:hypothetical protein
MWTKAEKHDASSHFGNSTMSGGRGFQQDDQAYEDMMDLTSSFSGLATREKNKCQKDVCYCLEQEAAMKNLIPDSRCALPCQQSNIPPVAFLKASIVSNKCKAVEDVTHKMIRDMMEDLDPPTIAGPSSGDNPYATSALERVNNEMSKHTFGEQQKICIPVGAVVSSLLAGQLISLNVSAVHWFSSGTLLVCS